eukprot:scaffold414422_cov38-Prasinocladus_malaysianus.AAC.1
MNHVSLVVNNLPTANGRLVTGTETTFSIFVAPFVVEHVVVDGIVEAGHRPMVCYKLYAG